MDRLMVYMPREECDRIREMASKADVSVSELLRPLVRSFIAGEGQPRLVKGDE
jgi:hypothetical protein